MSHQPLLSAVCVVAVAASVVPGPDAVQRHAMLVAEDTRPVTRTEAEPLLRGLGSPSPTIARLAVRGLGRLELPDVLPDIRRMLGDADAGVRAEAANALAQAAAGDPAAARAALRNRFEIERDPGVRAALCDALGRLPYESPDARIPVERLLARTLDGEFSSLVVRLGAARGLESLVRRARGTPYAFGAETLRTLRAAATGTARPAGTEDENRVRRLAVLALNSAGAIDAGYDRLQLDRDAEIRRLALAGADGEVAPDLRERLVTHGLGDASPVVRYEALRVHGRHLAAADCGAEIAALADPNPHVVLLAIDLLGSACPANMAATDALTTIARRPGPEASDESRAPNTWLPPAHAIVALARRAPDVARPLIGAFVAHDAWQVRMYAARAAAAAGHAPPLDALALDASASVRAAAIDGLSQVKRHDGDGVYLAALARPDYQGVMAAARALQGTPARNDATAALLKALDALTAGQRDTSRDPRLAILDRLIETGGPDHADGLAPYTADADPRVAARAADVLVKWTGEAREIRTTRLRTLPVPGAEELDSLPAGLRITLSTGRSFDIALFTEETPVTVWRIVRLVKQGYYNGLTYHRIVPNFIIQGGSPGADEFVGDGPFMRDELLVRSHERGTVGVSTRGRDTGDAQWFINLVDNPRLDHEYTIFGEVVAGMDAVDGILEGDVMRTVEPIPRLRSSGERTLPGTARQSR